MNKGIWRVTLVGEKFSTNLNFTEEILLVSKSWEQLAFEINDFLKKYKLSEKTTTIRNGYHIWVRDVKFVCKVPNTLNSSLAKELRIDLD